MKIKKIEIENFRGIREMTLELHPRLNVFAGKNGAGKSTVLEAIALPLSALFGQPPYYRKSRDPFGNYSDADVQVRNSHIRNGETEAAIRLFLDQDESPDVLMRLQRESATGYDGVVNSSCDMSDGLLASKRAIRDGSVPYGSLLAIRYLVDRYFDPAERRNSHDTLAPISAYFSALNCGHAYREFFDWFRDKQIIETHSLKVSWTEAVRAFQHGEKPDGADDQISAVRRTVEAFIEGLRALRIEYERGSSEPVMVVDKRGRQLAVSQLSDGERNLMALIGDLIRRLAVTNPDLKNPLQGEAVVMIDDIDLHFHPSWQRTVVPRLLETFPNVQFFLTTHSPQVLGEIREPESIVFLEDTPDGIVVQRCSEDVFGMESSQILEDLMGTPGRDEEIKKAVFDAYAALERNEIKRAKSIREHLWSKAKGIPELEGLDMQIRRKEMLGK
jgi:predicted ATP-binding protein involved in virulence